MNFRFVRTLAGCCCLLLGAAHFAIAQQGRGPGGPPPGRGAGPGGQPGPGGPPSYNAPGSKLLSQSSGSSAVNTRGGLQFGPPGRWWDDHTVTSAVGLRPVQQKKMDAIFDTNKTAILSSYKNLMAEQAKLDALNKQPNTDATKLFATIDSVNQARASLQKATTEMLLQIRSQMEPGQISKLEQLH